MTQRGDVVIVDFHFTDQPARKRRPAVVVQADTYNRLIAKTVIAMVTGNLARKNDPAHLFVDPATPEFTIDQEDIIKTLGRLSPVLEMKLDDCLKAALGMP
jgi:mRNA-degrading endonuclease toxin of MazEF toxin-antitoxin module